MDWDSIKFLSVGCGVCSAVATAYLFYKHMGNFREIAFLESVHRINELRDLAGELDLQNSTEPFYCAINGSVGCANPNGLRGVMVQRVVNEHYRQLDVVIKRKVTKGILTPKRKCDISDSWKLSFNALSSHLQEVPWYLDDGTAHVSVVGVGDSGFELPVTSRFLDLPHWAPVHQAYAGRSKFEGWDRARVHETENCIRISEIVVVERIERVLPVQTFLTVVGQATNTAEEGLRIRRSENRPLLISHLTLDEHIEKLASVGRWHERAFAGLTACCVAIYIISYILEDVIAENWAPVLHRLKRGLNMGM